MSNDWVLLRGLSREVGHFGDFPSMFERAVPGANAIPIDLPGFGEERARRSPLSMKGIVDDVRARFRARMESHAPTLNGGAPRVNILAISLGGMVALDWAARYPDDFDRVVVINTSAADSPPWQRFNLGMAARLPSFLVARDFRARERAILDVVSNAPAALKDTTADAWGVMFGQRTPDRRSAIRQILAAGTFGRPKQISAKLLVLASRGDRLVQHRCSERLATAYGAPLQLHDDGGHDLILDAPDWVCARVHDWVKQ